MTFFIVVGIFIVLIYLIHAKAVIWSLRLRKHLTANVLWTTWSASQKSWQWIFVRIFVAWNLTVSANLDKLMIGHGGTNNEWIMSESNNVTHEGHEHDLEEEESYFLLCSWVECNFISKYSVSVKKEKKITYTITSTEMIALILTSLTLFISLVYHWHCRYCWPLVF